jgi:hypothetical protein
VLFWKATAVKSVESQVVRDGEGCRGTKYFQLSRMVAGKWKLKCFVVMAEFQQGDRCSRGGWRDQARETSWGRSILYVLQTALSICVHTPGHNWQSTGPAYSKSCLLGLHCHRNTQVKAAAIPDSLGFPVASALWLDSSVAQATVKR